MMHGQKNIKLYVMW